MRIEDGKYVVIFGSGEGELCTQADFDNITGEIIADMKSKLVEAEVPLEEAYEFEQMKVVGLNATLSDSDLAFTIQLCLLEQQATEEYITDLLEEEGIPREMTAKMLSSLTLFEDCSKKDMGVQIRGLSEWTKVVLKYKEFYESE